MNPQDFSNQNLRGRSFKDQHLEGANFSYADIRGADFTHAKLKGADFSYATAGLQKRFVVLLTCISCIIAGFSGFLSVFIVSLVTAISYDNIQNYLLPLTGLMVIIILGIVIICQGLNTRSLALAVALFGPLAAVLAGAGPGLRSLGSLAVFVVFLALVLAVALAGTLAGTLVVALAVAGAVAVALAETVAGAGAGVVAGSLFGSLAGSLVLSGFGTRSPVLALAGTLAGASVLFSVYIARRGMKGDEKYSFIWNIAIVFAAIGGTNFRDANLTDANFMGATLKSTDLRNATLTRTIFHKTNLLNHVRPGKTYLQNIQLRELLKTGEGQGKKFDGQDLRGVNLREANLTNASFIGANLSEANLREAILTGASFIDANLSKANLRYADLSKAKLVKTQLDATDFTGATLTGACIQNWGITNDTKFNGVRCEYVYMRLRTKENRDPLRKPDNNKEVFADGDFGDFIKPIFDTLDLYHNQGVDPRAIAISFKELAENHPDAELEIVAMEKRGEDKFLLRAKTAVTANKSELSNEYFNTYNQIKGLTESGIQVLLAEKDSQIHRLENMVRTALERTGFFVQTYQNQGDTKMTESYQSKYDQRNANNQFVDTAQSGSNVTFNQTNYTSKQKQSLAAAEIQKLLKQLDETNPTATESEQIAYLKDNTTPNFRKRALSALESGSETAIDEFILENKLLKVGKAVIKGWLQPDK
jgi:uncharacterized protein YjbI with pentapeptide repeats